MEFLASLLVARPLNILAVAAFYFAAYLLLRITALGDGRHPRRLLPAVFAWLLYAFWEWLIQVRT